MLNAQEDYGSGAHCPLFGSRMPDYARVPGTLVCPSPKFRGVEAENNSNTTTYLSTFYVPDHGLLG